jgi:hypothetical protein
LILAIFFITEAPHCCLQEIGFKTWSEDLEELNLSFEKENFELQFRRLSEKIPDVSIKENSEVLGTPFY